MSRPGALAAVVVVMSVATWPFANAAPTVRFARGAHARLPFHLHNGHAWVRGIVNGSDSLWIVVDSGASSSAMDQGLAKTLGLESRGRHETLGAGGIQQSASVSDVTIRIGDISIHRERLDTVDFSALAAPGGHPMHVVLGYELFESCVVRFDYAEGVIDVWASGRAPRAPAEIEVPMTLEENHPYVEGVLLLPGRIPIRGRFVIDTGSSTGLILAPDVAQRDSLARAFPRTLQAMGRGVGGEQRNRIGRAESFSIGSLRFDGPLVVVPEPSAGRISAPATLGNIGGQLLGRCRVTFDYPRRRVRFERGADFARPFVADMSGISFARVASGWVVRFVNPDTPASEAGLREGDGVTTVDGKPAADLDLAVLRELLRGEGRSVRMGIRRGGTESIVTLVLRRLI